MPHPIYGPPARELEVLELKLVLPHRKNGHVTSVDANGICRTKRAPLWHYRETWTATEQRMGLEPADWVHHLALTALQDQPGTLEGLQQSLRGGAWEDVPLPF